MKRTTVFFASASGILCAGAAIGAIAVLLQQFGNPANMGLCVACFTRDIAGALGFHRAAAVQYLRPEIPAIVIGSLLAAALTGEFRPRAGSAGLLRFVLGAFAMIGALVFLGCPWRVFLRLAGGDLNAIAGLVGLVAGIFVATRFFLAGYDPGAAKKIPAASGIAFALLAASAIALLFVSLAAQPDATVPPFFSTKGPGSMHAPVVMSLLAGLAIGALLQRSRFCTIGAIRDALLFKQFHLAWGIAGLLAAAVTMNLINGTFTPGMHGQPIAHTDTVWNVLGMLLAGLAFTMAGGCPGRQCVLAGEGDADAALFVSGMLAGAAISHNFGLAATADGASPNARVAVVIGIAVCCILGILVRTKSTITSGLENRQ